jgi:hypothetical protein
LPSLRGTISGGGSAPPDEVILKLMEANRDDWDPEWDGVVELDGSITFDELIEEIVDAEDPVEGDEVGEQKGARESERVVPVVAMYSGEELRKRRERLLKQRAVKTWRAVKRGRLSPRALIESPPFFLGMVTVVHLYAAQPGWDVNRATRFLEGLSIDPASRIEDLTEEQRSRIVGAPAPSPPRRAQS